MDPYESRQARTAFSELECKDYTAPGNLGEHVEELLVQMTSEDPSERIQAVAALSMHLAVAPEENFSQFPLSPAISRLVQCLNSPFPEECLYSIISLNHIIDSIPKTCALVIQGGGLQSLCAKLSNFDYIDMAEHIIKILERLSHEFAEPLLMEGVFSSVLSMIEFFESSVQKRILNTVILLAQSAPSLELISSEIFPSLPVLKALCVYRDIDFFPTNEIAVKFFVTLIENVIKLAQNSAADFIRTIGEDGLLDTAVDLLVYGENESVIELIKLLCKFSNRFRKRFGLLGGATLIEQLLNKTENDSAIFKQTLELVAVVTPAVNVDYVFLPKVLDMYENTSYSKLLLLKVTAKMVEKCSIGVFEAHVSQPKFAEFIGELMMSKDQETVRRALSMAISLLKRSPEQVIINFIREGVVENARKFQDLETVKTLLMPMKTPLDLLGLRKSPYLEDLLKRMNKFQNVDLSEEIIKLANEFIEKCESFNKPECFLLIEELRDLDLNDDPDSLRKLCCILSNGVSMHEFMASSILDQLWNWLTEKKDLNRIVEFLKLTADGSFDMLAKLITKSVRFTSQFIINIHQNYGIHNTFKQLLFKSKLTLQYAPQSEPPFESKHTLYSEYTKIMLFLDLYQTLEATSEALMKAENLEDLKLLVNAYDRTNNLDSGRLILTKQSLKVQNLLTNYPNLQSAYKDLNISLDENQRLSDIPAKSMQQLNFEPANVVFVANNAVISKSMTMYEILNKHFNGGKDMCVIQFYFEELSNDSEEENMFENESSLIENFVEESENVAVPLKLIKLFSLFSKNKEVFISQKLSGLVSKQLQDSLAMIGGLYPSWVKEVASYVPSLFSFDNRVQIFKHLAYTNGRSLYYLNNKSVKLLRQKATVSRDSLINSALKLFEDSALLKYGLLEFVFEDEVGTGQGPTFEFYALISSEIRKMPIWRNGKDANGLYPSPMQEMGIFKFIGKLVAKALLDDRRLNLPLSPAFWKLILRQKVNIFDISHVDRELGRHLLELNEIVSKKKWIYENFDDEIQIEKQLGHLNIKGASIADLCLPFTLPGYDIELKPDGANEFVSLDNLEEYINLIGEFTFKQEKTAKEFREGFDELIPVELLNIFESEELEEVVCGVEIEEWPVSMLLDSVVADHGYNKSSATFNQFLDIISHFSSKEKALFLQFATGSPRLPLGGFKALSPPLTVVRKITATDDHLPSVMTCQNYLKIPEYSSSEVLENRLKFAIQHAHLSFHLS